MDLDERVLDDVVGGSRVADKPRDELKQFAIISPHEQGKRLLVAVEEFGQQALIAATIASFRSVCHTRPRFIRHH